MAYFCKKTFIYLVIVSILTLVGFPFDAIFAQTSSSSNPAENLRCWTEKACEGDGSQGAIVQGKWDNESRAAVKECPGYGYCFPIPENIPLAIAIPGSQGSTHLVTQVKDLGQYISVIYNYLLGFAVIITIVMLMVGGVQYVLAAGVPSQLAQAQKRISSALIGLVLLFCAVLILLTVNPQLIALKLPTLPKIRQIVFISSDVSCEDLIAQNYVVHDASGSLKTEGKCGEEKGKVVQDSKGNPIKDEKTCRWTSCAGQTDLSRFHFTKICTEVKGKDQCISCMDVTADNDLEIPASGSTCAALTPREKQGKKWYQYVSCQFSKDSGFSQSQQVDSAALGQCALIAINCQDIDACSEYDEEEVVNNDGSEPLDSFSGPTVLKSFDPIRNICEPNVCGSIYQGDMTGKSCRLYEAFKSNLVECVSASDPRVN